MARFQILVTSCDSSTCSMGKELGATT